jgi:hypothetical protein
VVLIGADSAAVFRKLLIACCGRIARDSADTDRDRDEFMRRNAELQQQIRDLQQLPQREPEASLALNFSESMDGSSFWPDADNLEEKGRHSPVSAPVGHGEAGEETDQRLHAAQAADTQFAAGFESLCEKLAAALVQNN